MKLLFALLLLAAVAPLARATAEDAAPFTAVSGTTLRLRELLAGPLVEPDWAYRELVARLAERGVEAHTLAAIRLERGAGPRSSRDGALVMRVGERDLARVSLAGIGTMSRRVLLAPDVGLKQLGMRMRVNF